MLDDWLPFEIGAWTPWNKYKKVVDTKNKSLKESNILGNENFQPPFNFCMQLGVQGGCTKMPF